MPGSLAAGLASASGRFLRASAEPAGRKPRGAEPQPRFDEDDWRIIRESIVRETRSASVVYRVAPRPREPQTLTA